VDKVAKWVNEIVETRRRFVVSDKQKIKKAREKDSPEKKRVKDGKDTRGAYIKIEDKQMKYQPLYKELTSFPTVCIGSNQADSPFVKQNVTRYQAAQQKNTQAVSRSTKLHLALAGSNSKSGFCELCEQHFTHRGRHINSAKHLSNVTSENFRKLDALIANGESFSDFVKNVKGMAKSKEEKKSLERTRKSSPHGKKAVSQSVPLTVIPKDLSKKEEMVLKKRPRTAMSRSKIASLSSVMFNPTKRKKGSDDEAIEEIRTVNGEVENARRTKTRTQRKSNRHVVAKVQKGNNRHQSSLRKSRRRKRVSSGVSSSSSRY